MNKKVLVLGGTGAMGVYLIPELLSMGYEVFVTSRTERTSDVKNLHYIKGNAKENIFLTEVLASNKFDAIIDFMLYNTKKFNTRVDMLLKSTKHYLFLSSYRVYGDNGMEPINEEAPRLLDTVNDQEYLQTDEYALTKARQENRLMESDFKNWTILRPAITYSKERFQLGTMEAHEFLVRALNGKTIIFPKEILSKRATMSWAGDVAKMIAKVVLNEQAYGESYTVTTAEHHTWSEIIGYYKKFLNMKVKYVSVKKYEEIVNKKYLIQYNRMYDYVIDNSKILNLTKMRQKDLMKLEDGLRMELATFSKKPNYKAINVEQQKKMDKITEPKAIKIIKRIKIRTRIKQIKGFIRGKFLYDGAIVSLSGYHNYGGLIQRYALQEFLKKNGYKFKVFSFEFMLKMGKKVGNRKNTIAFAKKYLDQERFNPRTSKYYKTYIVGSDQVWRNWFQDWERFKMFFLNFVKNKKTKRIGYSVSFGIDNLESAGINQSNIGRIKKLVKKFDYISVREKSAEKLVKELGKDSVTTLDPTLLLSASEYSRLIENSSSNNISTSEIFYYLLDPNTDKYDRIKDFEEKMNMKADGILPNNGLKLPTVESWLKGFRDSKLVITDSFHGMVFSIINRTPFVVFGNEERGLSRMKDLLELFGLENRIMSDSDEINEELFNLENIDWKNVDDKLLEMQEESGRYLLNSLSKKK